MRTSAVDVAVPSVRSPSSSRSGRGMHSVTSPVPSVCVPSIDRLITPAGAAGSGQSLFEPAVRSP